MCAREVKLVGEDDEIDHGEVDRRYEHLHTSHCQVGILKERPVLHIVEQPESHIRLAQIVRQYAGPDALSERKCVHIEARYDSKIVRATLECPPKIRVLGGVRVDNLAAADDDLKIDYIGAREAAAAEEGSESV